jgi:hypothetical protein
MVPSSNPMPISRAVFTRTVGTRGGFMESTLSIGYPVIKRATSEACSSCCQRGTMHRTRSPTTRCSQNGDARARDIVRAHAEVRAPLHRLAAACGASDESRWKRSSSRWTIRDIDGHSSSSQVRTKVTRRCRAMARSMGSGCRC